MINRLNSDLANNLGNLLNRSTNLLRKYFSEEDLAQIFSSKLPSENLLEQNTALASSIHYFTEFQKNVQEIDFFNAFNSLFNALNEMNLHMSNTAPWTLLKNGNAAEKLIAFNCLYAALESCRKAAICLAPLTPNLSKNIFIQLGIINEDFDIENRYKALAETFSFSHLEKNPLSLENLNSILASQSKPVFERILEKEAV